MRRWAAILAAFSFGCTADTGGPGADASSTTDVGVFADAGDAADASGPSDMGAPDGLDGGESGDASAVLDSGVRPDSGVGTLGTWRRLAPQPMSQQETGVAALNGEMYVVGGLFGAAQRLAVYDPRTDTWRTAADVPVAMHHANVAVVADKLYIVGYLSVGFGGRGRVFEFDPATNAWTEKTPMPAGTERGGSATGVIGGRIFVAGGQDGSTSLDDFSAYDPARDTWTALMPLPSARDHLVGGVVDGVFYIIGGRSGGIRGHTSEVHAFDPARPQWSPRAPMPTSRAGAAAAVHTGRIFVFGGEGNPARGTDGVFAETEMYSPSLDRWSSLALMRTPRHGMGAATLGDLIHVPGGGVREAVAPDATHEAFLPP